MPDVKEDALLVSRLFTVREANLFIPTLTTFFPDARELLARAQELARELAELGSPIGDVEALAVDEEAPNDVKRRQREVAGIVRNLRELLARIAEMGAEVKAADGLVDFRSRHKGEIVYLCWKFGEETITHWHDLTAGIAGRAPIADESMFEGDLLQ